MSVDCGRPHCEQGVKRLPRLDFFPRGGFTYFLSPMTEHSQEIHDQNDHPITTTSPSPVVMASNSIKLLTGNSHPALAKAVADQSVNPVLDSI
jgi:hypothetical protein